MSIAPDDPRHGSDRGYRAGCHERCCLDGTALYERRRSKLKEMGHDRRLDPTGAKRRIQALQALGWTQNHIAEAGGWSNGSAVNKMLRDSTAWVFVSTVKRANLAYSRLSMRVGPSRSAALYAARQGWSPPLAWDDDQLDDPKAKPVMVGRSPADRKSERLVNPMVVEAVLSGVRMPEATNKERREATRLWQASGRPLAELGRLQGWRVDRYLDKSEVAA